MPNIKINDGLEGNPARRHYLRNRAAILKRTGEYQRAHREQSREYVRQYKIRKFGIPRIKTQEERFLEKVIPEPNSGCWIWLGTVQKNGYARTAFGSRNSGLAHKWSYLNFVGAVPAGLELDHRCRVRCCVNPKHLEAITHLENMRRGAAARRLRNA